MFQAKLTQNVIEENCNCAGIFMTKCDPSNPKDIRVLLVESKRKNYSFSFPKGRRNKGELTLEAAKREFHEETGLDETVYDVFADKWYIEYRSDTGKPHIVYYLGKMKKDFLDAKLNPIDTKEIVSANWFTPDEIYAMRKSFYLQRRQITTRAIKDILRGYEMDNILKTTSQMSQMSQMSSLKPQSCSQNVSTSESIQPSQERISQTKH